MKSEMFEDMEKLSAAWESHCDGDSEHRSVLVIGTDVEDGHERLFINYVGKAWLIASGILQFFQSGEAKDVARIVVSHLLAKDDKMRKVTGWTCVGSVAWIVFLVWFHFFSGLDGGGWGGGWKDFIGSAILPIWASVFTGYMYRRFAK